MSDVIIYTLKDPITNDIRYIGKTTQTLNRRLQIHVYKSRKSTTSHKKAWIKGLLNKGLKPIIEKFDEVSNDDWKFWEQYWISQFKAWGFKLTNTTAGGEGVDKGTIPWNKGLKGSIPSNETSFEKGNEIGKENRFTKGNEIGKETRFSKDSIVWNKGESDWMTEDHKKKLSKTHTGNTYSNKAVIQYTMDMEYVAEYGSAKVGINGAGKKK